MNTKSSFILFNLFAMFFGLAFTIEGSERTEGSIDSLSYRLKFERYLLTDYWEYFEGLKGFLTFDDGNKDYYFDTIAFYVSRITDNYHIMFLVFAIVFAFFQLGSLRFFVSNKNFRDSIYCIFLAYLFTGNQIFNINGMRFWTAAWIGVYCFLQIYVNNRKKYYLLALCTPFFHGSFWIYVAFLLGVNFVKRYDKLWSFLFLVSFFFSSIAFEVIASVSQYLPAFLSTLVDSYTDKEYIAFRNQSGTGFWIVGEIFKVFVKIYLNLLMFLLIRNKKRIINQNEYNLYQVLIVWFTVMNFFIAVPSLGGRFIILGYPILAYLWLSCMDEKKFRKLIYLLPFVFFMTIKEQLYLYMEVIDMSFLFSNPFCLLYKYLTY